MKKYFTRKLDIKCTDEEWQQINDFLKGYGAGLSRTYSRKDALTHLLLNLPKIKE